MVGITHHNLKHYLNDENLTVANKQFPVVNNINLVLQLP
ncbi:hypothetical protein B6N60_02450 [Richelia sinica FACHB-800]|uniref:Uncharacterized protein n=1 Tax=Richelia sinica FACHB-800 TaxID=1357546 RepID=A0A975Y518_9NOST|nr:hypothetical protein B6N60_02450 [Richelia sinica FACHB-800]